MKFTLYYKGPLRPNGGARDKLFIRRALHPQLCQLWEHDPLRGMKHKFLDPSRNPETPPRGNNLLFQVGHHRFGCIVSSRLHATAQLEIVLLRPEVPGRLLAQSGDLDNRLKTLLDALALPSQPAALPKDFEPEPGEDPFFCLLEDDSLVTALSVRTHRWLNPEVGSDLDAVALIHVETDTSVKTFENVDF